MRNNITQTHPFITSLSALLIALYLLHHSAAAEEKTTDWRVKGARAAFADANPETRLMALEKLGYIRDTCEKGSHPKKCTFSDNVFVCPTPMNARLQKAKRHTLKKTPNFQFRQCHVEMS